MYSILIVFGAFFALRLCSLAVSIKNEKRIIKLGASEYGTFNSKLLTIAHVVFYFSALTEAYFRGQNIDNTSLIGIGTMLFAYVMLFYVMYSLRAVWTVKLYILPNHEVVRSLLFRTVKHPNYFLNIIPELIGVGLLCHSWYTLCFIFPIYCLILSYRIRLENQLMKSLW